MRMVRYSFRTKTAVLLRRSEQRFIKLASSPRPDLRGEEGHIKTQSALLLLFTLLVAVVGLSQTTKDFSKQYGPSDDSGRYIVRPGIGMTVRVDDAGVIRDITIRPIQPAT